MIIVEMQLKEIQSQREALKRELLYKMPSDLERARIDGAITVLDWLEYGHQSPTEALL